MARLVSCCEKHGNMAWAKCPECMGAGVVVKAYVPMSLFGEMEGCRTCGGAGGAWICGGCANEVQAEKKSKAEVMG